MMSASPLHYDKPTHLGTSEADSPPATHDARGEEHKEDGDERQEHADGRVRDSAARRRALRKTQDGGRGGDGARLGPLAVAVDDGVLEAVDELGERDVLAVLEDVDRAEVLARPVAELEAEEVARVGRGRAAQLDRDRGPEVGWGTGMVSPGGEARGDVRRLSVHTITMHEREIVMVEAGSQSAWRQ